MCPCFISINFLPKSLFRVELSGRMVYDRKLDTSHMDDDIF